MMGRSDDTLKVAGKRLGPAEVEEVVLELPDVAEAAAIGVADADKGQKLVVFIVPKPDSDVAGAELEAIVSGHVDKRLGRPFRPGRVHGRAAAQDAQLQDHATSDPQRVLRAAAGRPVVA